MRILRVAQDIFPEVVGGAPYHIHALSRDQARRGHDVTVLTVSDADGPARDTRDGYTVVRQSPTVDLFGNELFANTLGYLRGNTGYDVIHAHSHLFYSSNVAAAYGRLADTPLAVTCHGLHSQRVPEWFSRAHLKTVGRATYNAADVIFCYTAVERDLLRDLGVTSPARVVNNGVDTERFSPVGESADRIDAVDGPAVLFAGRLVEGKRPRDALAAFERVREEIPDATLFFCGDGPLQSEIRTDSERAGIDDSVMFLGRVPYEEMPSIYRAADLFVLTSRTEGFPRPVMEALACGVPVVSTHLEQTAAVVERAGETVPVCDVKALAAAMVDILEDPDRRAALGRAGREIITAEYDWSQTVEQTTEALKRLTETRPRPVARDPAVTENAPLREESSN
jgi:glycosyltransferase involved in cell wall biosynthesis